MCYVLSCFSCVRLFCDPMYCSPPGSSIHGILLARILKWVAIFSFRGSFPPRDWTQVSYVACIDRQVFLPLAPPGNLKSGCFTLHTQIYCSEFCPLKGFPLFATFHECSWVRLFYGSSPFYASSKITSWPFHEPSLGVILSIQQEKPEVWAAWDVWCSSRSWHKEV